LLKIVTDIQHHLYWKEMNIYEEQEANCEWNIIRIIKTAPKQNWHGMGGSFTESSCYNFTKLPFLKQQEFIENYFGESGLNYNFGRISIGSNDFSLQSYDYLRDENLSHFTIEHDCKAIIPTIQKVLKYKNLTLLASPWTPPKFMKSNHSLTNGGKLLLRYYDLYAKYLVLFLKSYQEKGIYIKYLTMQNEPFAVQNWESCVYSFEDQRKFIYRYLLPQLRHTSFYLLLWDHNKENLPMVVSKIFRKNKRVAGVAYHWYTGIHSENLDYVSQKYPQLLLVHTEGCCGFSKYEEFAWVQDAELLLMDLLEDINHGMNAYIDWNLLLDYSGGPNWQHNYCKSPIILNETGDDFYLTPIYYYFGHISRYIKPGSRIFPISKYRLDILGVAFFDGQKYGIVLLNPNDYNINVNLAFSDKVYCDVVKSHTIVTYFE